VGLDGQSKDSIHLVWYVVNAAHARFEPFERELCIKLFSRVPIFFLLNKADLSTQMDRDQLRKVIADMKLPNCCGIFDIIADEAPKTKTFDVCPMCESDDVMERRKRAVLICNDCGHEESLRMDHGLTDVVRSSLSVLPDVVKDNFVAAQSVSFSLKEETSHRVISDFWADFSCSCSYDELVRTISMMIARLSLIWEFTGHSEEIGALLASDLVEVLKLKHKTKRRSNRKKNRGPFRISTSSRDFFGNFMEFMFT